MQFDRRKNHVYIETINQSNGDISIGCLLQRFVEQQTQCTSNSSFCLQILMPVILGFSVDRNTRRRFPSSLYLQRPEGSTSDLRLTINRKI